LSIWVIFPKISQCLFCNYSHGVNYSTLPFWDQCCFVKYRTANAVNHLHFIVGIKFGKMNAVNAKFKHRCKMSGGFTLLAYVLFDGAGGHSC